jgi:hypothetical protein
MKRTLVLFVAIAGLASLVWGLFGYSISAFAGGELRTRRFFGRVVRAEADVNGDGRMDEEYVYSWSEPMRHHQPPQRILSDRNFDGRWDLWITPISPDADGYARNRYAGTRMATVLPTGCSSLNRETPSR